MNVKLATALPLVLLLTGPAFPADRPKAGVAVIHDAGGVPLRTYLEGSEWGPPEQHEPPNAAPLPAPVPVFPVSSVSAGPGRLLQNPMHSKLPGGPGRAFFIVGNDPLSLEWLRQNAGVLRRLRARGIVASVETEVDFRRLRATTGLPMVPMPADALLDAAGIHVWPVLINADGSISQ